MCDLVACVKSRSITIILIEHNMGFVMKICNKVEIMRNGVLIVEGRLIKFSGNLKLSGFI